MTISNMTTSQENEEAWLEKSEAGHNLKNAMDTIEELKDYMDILSEKEKNIIKAILKAEVIEGGYINE